MRTEVIGPVLTKIWDTPESTRTERMKHVIEPTFAVDYTTEFANQSQVPNTNDAADQIVGGAARVTYGVTNRLFYRGRPTEDVTGADAGVRDAGRAADLLHGPAGRASTIRAT